MHNITIGIDLGGSATKLVGIRDGEIFSPLFASATDPATALFGTFGRYLNDNGIKIDEISHVRLTGVGSTFIHGNVCDIPTQHINEFAANAAGVRQAIKNERIIVVSMGTGTSLVKMEGDDMQHIGGMGIGGGTIQGLSRLLLKTGDVGLVSQWANAGDEKRMNLQIGDLCNNDLPGLPLHATASLLGKAAVGEVNREDIACGILYMVLQTIGSAAIMASGTSGIKDFVLIGNLTRLSLCRRVFDELEAMYGVTFHIPSFAEYRTAIGAALL